MKQIYLLEFFREKRKITKSVLCKGICSVAYYNLMARDGVVANQFIWDAIFERLGYSSDFLDYFMVQEDYYYFELREKIHNALSLKEFEKVEILLEEYQRNYQVERQVLDLHKQFILKIRGIRLFIQKQYKNAEPYFLKGLALTRPEALVNGKLNVPKVFELPLCI